MWWTKFAVTQIGQKLYLCIFLFLNSQFAKGKDCVVAVRTNVWLCARRNFVLLMTVWMAWATRAALCLDSISLMSLDHEERKFVCVHAMNVYIGRGGVAPHIRNFGTIWKWMARITPWPLNPWGENLRSPFNVDLRAGVDVLEKTKVVLFIPGLKACIVQPVDGRCPVGGEVPPWRAYDGLWLRSAAVQVML